jgi:hypothetical protein
MRVGSDALVTVTATGDFVSYPTTFTATTTRTAARSAPTT